MTSRTPIMSPEYFSRYSHLADLKVLRTPNDPLSNSDRYLSPGQNISDTYVRFLNRKADKFREWRERGPPARGLMTQEQRDYDRAGRKLLGEARAFVLENSQSSKKSRLESQMRKGLSRDDEIKMAEDIDRHMGRLGWTHMSMIELDMERIRYEEDEPKRKEKAEQEEKIEETMKALFGEDCHEHDDEDDGELAHIYSFDELSEVELAEDEIAKVDAEVVVKMIHALPTPPPSPMSKPSLVRDLRLTTSLDNRSLEVNTTTPTPPASDDGSKASLGKGLDCINIFDDDIFEVCQTPPTSPVSASEPKPVFFTSKSVIISPPSAIVAQTPSLPLHVQRRDKFYTDLRCIRRQVLNSQLGINHFMRVHDSLPPISLRKDQTLLKRLTQLANFFLVHPPSLDDDAEYDLSSALISELQSLTGFFVNKILADLKTDPSWKQLEEQPKEGTRESKQGFYDEERMRFETVDRKVPCRTATGMPYLLEYYGWNEGESRDSWWEKMKIRGRFATRRWREGKDSAREDILRAVVKSVVAEYEDEEGNVREEAEAWTRCFEQCDEDSEGECESESD